MVVRAPLAALIALKLVVVPKEGLGISWMK